jgi:hypothetical protein
MYPVYPFGLVFSTGTSPASAWFFSPRSLPPSWRSRSLPNQMTAAAAPRVTAQRMRGGKFRCDLVQRANYHLPPRRNGANVSWHANIVITVLGSSQHITSHVTSIVVAMALKIDTTPLDDTNRIDNGESERQTRRRVQFEQNNNDIVHVVPRNPKEIWYNEDEYRGFKRLWRSNQVQRESGKEADFCLELLGFQNTTMETNQSFSKEAWLRRVELKQIIFKHQDECRLRGLYDPDGASVLSKSASMHDLCRALKSAAANAEEAKEYRKEISQIQSSPTSVSQFPLLNMNDLADPIECALSFSCAKWQFDNIEGREILNYQRKFENAYEVLSEGESASSSSSDNEDEW